MDYIKESQKSYLTRSNIIMAGIVCVLSNILLTLAITDFFSETPFAYENFSVFMLMIASTTTYLVMLKKYKE